MDDNSGKDNLSDEDAAVNGFFNRADEVAKLSPQEQEAWLARVADAARGIPDLEKTLEQLRDYLKAARQKHEAREAAYRSDVKLVHSSEVYETLLRARLEALLSGSHSLPEDPQARTAAMLQLTIMGHIFPDLKERFAQEDAQQYLARFMRENPLPDMPPDW